MPPEELPRQLRRFLVVGLGSVATDWAVTTLLSGAGLGAHAAKGAGYVAGMLLGFAGNKFWTFRSARRSLAEPVAYAALYAATLGVNVAVNALALAALGDAATGPAFLAATGVTTVLNFAGMRLVTFREGLRRRYGDNGHAVHRTPD